MRSNVIPFPATPWWLREIEYHSRKVQAKPRKILANKLASFPTVVKIGTAKGGRKALLSVERSRNVPG